MWGQSCGGPRKLTTIFSALLAISLCLSTPNARALTTIEQPFDQLVSQSDQILVGTVSQASSFWGEGRASDTIFSDIKISEIEQIKGELNSAEFSLKVIGGVIGDQAQFYPGLPQFVSGQRYLLFIKGNNRAMFPITGVTQGFYRVQWDASQEREIVIPTTGGNTMPLSRNARKIAHQHTNQNKDLNTLISEIRASMAPVD